MESLKNSTNQEEEGQTTEMLINQSSQNQTENKVRTEEELKALLQETSVLRKELESAKSEIEKLKNKSSVQHQQCKIEFELDFPSNEAKAEVLKIVGGLPDVTSITMEDKRLSLKGIDIDPLGLREKLKNKCGSKLVRFYVYEVKKEEKKEEKKIEPPYPYYPPRGPPYPNNPQMFKENYGANFRLKEAGIIFMAVFLSLLLLRVAPYANVLV